MRKASAAAAPDCRGPGYPGTFRRVCEAAGVRGNLAFDAQVVAACLEHGVSGVLTADRGFSRFEHVRAEWL